jgi:hypothetical protein
MMNYGLAFVLFFIVAFFSNKLPFLKFLQEIKSLMHRIVNVFQSKISSDYRKEHLLKGYALRLFIASVKITFLLLIVLLGAFLILLFFSQFVLKASNNILEFILTLQSGIVSFLAFIVYYLIKRAYAKFRL